MTEEEKVAVVRTSLGSDDPADTDVAIKTYLRYAAQEVLDRRYPFGTDETEVPDRYALNQCEIAVYLLNKRGAEGQTAHSENGISRSYEKGGVPASMLSRITPLAGTPR